jgi:hypothetical protein
MHDSLLSAMSIQGALPIATDEANSSPQTSIGRVPYVVATFLQAKCAQLYRQEKNSVLYPR